MSQASSVPDMPQRSRDNIPDLLRPIPVKLAVKDGKISNQADDKEVGEIWQGWGRS